MKSSNWESILSWLSSEVNDLRCRMHLIFFHEDDP